MFEVVYERLIYEVKLLVLKGVVNYVRKVTFEPGVPNPCECFVRTNEYVYQDFNFEFQQVH